MVFQKGWSNVRINNMFFNGFILLIKGCSKGWFKGLLVLIKCCLLLLTVRGLFKKVNSVRKLLFNRLIELFFKRVFQTDNRVNTVGSKRFFNVLIGVINVDLLKVCLKVLIRVGQTGFSTC